MNDRDLAEERKQQPYFKAVAPVEIEEGTREMGELYPFIICGGSKTERYYFTHINDTTEYKFNIRPRYFGDEARYTDVFPKRIREIQNSNQDAKIYCVFDWDTIYGNKARLSKHDVFLRLFQKDIASEAVVICPSMPSIEYWFLLHFVDYTNFLRNYGAVANKLAYYLKDCFPDHSIPLKKLLKMEKHLKEPIWVKKMCADGKFESAIERAEKNINAAIKAKALDSQSYTFVYKIFKKE